MTQRNSIMIRSIRGRILAALLCALATSASAEDVAAEKAARAALDSFFVAWNKADNTGLREAMNFPHVTLAGNGRMIIADEPSDFTTNFDGMREREGWARSSLDDFRVTYSAPNKVHCSVVYSRYASDGTRYRTAAVFYIMTKKDGHWGMQFRGPMPLDGDVREASEKLGRALLDEFFIAFNAGDNKVLRVITNWPHAFLLGNGRLSVAKEPAQLTMNFERMRESEGWHRSTLDSATVVAKSDDVLYIEIVFSRHHSDGTKYRSVPALWILTNNDGHWGLQFRSLMPAVFSLEEGR